MHSKLRPLPLNLPVSTGFEFGGEVGGSRVGGNALLNEGDLGKVGLGKGGGIGGGIDLGIGRGGGEGESIESSERGENRFLAFSAQSSSPTHQSCWERDRWERENATNAELR